MKKIKLLAMAVAMMFTATCFTACGSDDDGEGIGNIDLPTPQYEQVSGKYEITQAGSPYESIELGASGNYVVTRSYGGYSLAPKAEGRTRMALLAKRGTTRSTEYYGMIYGTFTSLGGGKYDLEGFGTIKLKYSGDNVTGIEVTTNGTTTNYAAEKAPTMSNDDITNALCRTWKITQWRAYLRYDHETMYDFSAPTVDELNAKIREWGQEVDPDYTDDDYLIEFNNGNAPQELIFTKSGTYMVTYADSKLAVSTWRWANQTKGLLEYSWNPFSFDPEELYGRATITFRNNKLEINEGYSDEEDGYLFEQGTTYTLEEVK